MTAPASSVWVPWEAERLSLEAAVTKAWVEFPPMFLAASSSVLVLTRTRTMFCISWEWVWLWRCNQDRMLLYTTSYHWQRWGEDTQHSKGKGKALTLQGKEHSFPLGENWLERANLSVYSHFSCKSSALHLLLLISLLLLFVLLSYCHFQ